MDCQTCCFPKSIHIKPFPVSTYATTTYCRPFSVCRLHQQVVTVTLSVMCCPHYLRQTYMKLKYWHLITSQHFQTPSQNILASMLLRCSLILVMCYQWLPAYLWFRRLSSHFVRGIQVLCRPMHDVYTCVAVALFTAVLDAWMGTSNRRRAEEITWTMIAGTSHWLPSA